MLNVNKFICAGHLTKDPKMGKSPKGGDVANLNLAVNRKWKDTNGNWRVETLFIGVEVWGKAAKGCEEFLVKGSPVFVEGRLASKLLPVSNGEQRSVIDVVSERIQFLGPKKFVPNAEASVEEEKLMAESNS